MTEDELCDRLFGEEAIDLAIEKWIRLKNWLFSTRNALSPSSQFICSQHRSSTCALCKINTHLIPKKYFRHDKKTFCEDCLLSQYDLACNDFNSSYKFFIQVFSGYAYRRNTFEELIRATEDMISVLIRCKNRVEIEIS
jgi:hypothetical protein